MGHPHSQVNFSASVDIRKKVDPFARANSACAHRLGEPKLARLGE